MAILCVKQSCMSVSLCGLDVFPPQAYSDSFWGFGKLLSAGTKIMVMTALPLFRLALSLYCTHRFFCTNIYISANSLFQGFCVAPL